MGRATSAFRQRDLTRAIRGMEAAGVKVGGATIAPDGSITIMVASEPAKEALTPLQQWKADRDARGSERTA